MLNCGRRRRLGVAGREPGQRQRKGDEVTDWGCSSVGRAIALQAIGHRFDSVHLHQTGVEREEEFPVDRDIDVVLRMYGVGDIRTE